MAFSFVWKFLVAVVVFNGVLAVPAPSIVQDNDVEGRSNDDGNWNVVMKVVEGCSDKDMLSCLGVKAVAMLDRASRMANIEIVDGINFVGSAEESRNGRALLTEAEMQNSLETAPAGRTSRLLDMIMESVTRFFESHSLQFKLPEAAKEGIQKVFEEGRKKKFKIPKRLSPLLMAFGAKLALLVPLALAATKFLVIKALIVAKLALLIAGALAVQKLISGGGLSSLGSLGTSYSSAGHGSSAGWSSGGGSSYSPAASGGWSSGGPYSRSIDDAHQMAFAAQAPEHVKAQ